MFIFADRKSSYCDCVKFKCATRNLEENMNSAVKPYIVRFDENPNWDFDLLFLLVVAQYSEGAGKTKADQTSGNHFDKQWTD